MSNVASWPIPPESVGQQCRSGNRLKTSATPNYPWIHTAAP